VNRPARHVTAAPVLAILGCAVAIATGGCGNSSSAASKTNASPPPTKLTGTVQATGSVTLETSNGNPVTSLHNGWYTMLVRVNSTDADFHLVGPSVDSATKVGVAGVALWGIHLLKGTYRYMNDRDPHATARVLSVY